jgi:hypothetical protein
MASAPFGCHEQKSWLSAADAPEQGKFLTF